MLHFFDQKILIFFSIVHILNIWSLKTWFRIRIRIWIHKKAWIRIQCFRIQNTVHRVPSAAITHNVLYKDTFSTVHVHRHIRCCTWSKRVNHRLAEWAWRYTLTCVLQGEEESCYWTRIEADKADKRSGKVVVPKPRSKIEQNFYLIFFESRVISLQFTILPYLCTYFNKASIYSKWVLTPHCHLPSP
jgi:hypothetical protein